MGLDVQCKARYQGHESAGRAQLESDYLLFRGDFRVKVSFAEMTSVMVTGGELRITTAAGVTCLVLGKAAEKWAEKILHPPTLIEKLGVKPGQRISLVGFTDAEFSSELSGQGCHVTVGPSNDSDLVFFRADGAPDLQRMPDLIKSLASKGALWIVYPKGVRAITEAQVLAAARAAGLVDVKVVRFSPTHTALKTTVRNLPGR